MSEVGIVVLRRPQPSAVYSDVHTLLALRQELLAARSAVRAARSGNPRLRERSKAAEADLLASLEAFAAALTARRLPIPRGLRDELRLRRTLSASSPA